MIEAGITGAAVALLNGVKEAADGNYKALALTIAAGFVALLVSWLVGTENLREAFVLGMGGSGVYKLVTVARGSNE